MRQCDYVNYENSYRPCLQHQIEYCTAPCVELVSEADYWKDVKNTIIFPEGKIQRAIEQLSQQMEQASEQPDVKQAVTIKNKIISFRKIQEHQYINLERENLDVLAAKFKMVWQLYKYTLFVK